MSARTLENQVAIITGAARGIGLGIAEVLGKHGARLALLDVDYPTLIDRSKDLERIGYQTLPLKVDVRNREDIVGSLREINEQLGNPNILVNNAGIYTSSPLLEVSPEEWGNTIAVNLTGTFYCCQSVAPYMMKTNYGRIINISSLGGKIGWSRNHAYCASKSGVIALSRVLALELASYNITVNAVCPGNTDTEMLKAIDENITRTENLEPGTFIRQQVQQIPLGRYAKPYDIGALVAFLASRDADYITGQAVNVDGGAVMY